MDRADRDVRNAGTGQLPVRVPLPTGARRHAPADEQLLRRVRDGLLGWTPGTFLGTSVIDQEALRALAAEAALHPGNCYD